MSRLCVFLDVCIGEAHVGRIVVELFGEEYPEICERFLARCIASEEGRSYIGASVTQILPGTVIIGGTSSSATRARASGVAHFDGAENSGWKREVDAIGLACITQGQELNDDQFLVTLRPLDTIEPRPQPFGRLVEGQDILARLSIVPTTDCYTPNTAITLTNCGVLEAPLEAHNQSPDDEQRGRLKRRRMSSHSPPRAPSPSRGHDRDSGSRHRHHYRKHRRRSSSSSVTPPAFASTGKHRRRSDAEPDHTLRGRARKRSGSRGRNRSPILEGDEKEVRKGHRKRSPPPSRHRSESAVGEGGAVRRQRSLPNLYHEGMGRVLGSVGGRAMEGIQHHGVQDHAKDKDASFPTVPKA